MRYFIILTLVAVSCNVQDPELQRLEQLEVEIKQQAVKDSIHFERVERLINAGMTYDEAEAKVKEIESR